MKQDANYRMYQQAFNSLNENAKSDKKDFYTDYASYCNQAGFFKNLTFKEFLEKRHKNRERINYSLSVYEEALTCQK